MHIGKFFYALYGITKKQQRCMHVRKLFHAAYKISRKKEDVYM